MALTRLAAWAVFLGASLAGCGPSPSNELVAARPYALVVPKGFDGSRPIPLVILLHGYRDSGFWASSYFGLGPLVDQRTFLYAHPDGTVDSVGNRFWNATDACCNFEGSRVDDVAYINAVIDDVSAHYNVDPKRIFLVGHSNGGFLAHRLACELSPRIAAIVSVAGANWYDPERCQPKAPVSILQVHGDADENVAFEGGDRHGNRFPSAPATVNGWGTRNGCTQLARPTGAEIDLDSGPDGDETVISTSGGCPASGAAELWTIRGGSHRPGFQPGWPLLIYDWLLAHPRLAVGEQQLR